MRLRGGRVATTAVPSNKDSWHRAHVAMHAKEQPRKVDVAEIQVRARVDPPLQDGYNRPRFQNSEPRTLTHRQAIERFYEKLCHLVERQRVTDPFSLSLVHKVKSLLEQGLNMNRSLLIRVMEHVREIYGACARAARGWCGVCSSQRAVAGPALHHRQLDKHGGARGGRAQSWAASTTRT
jgi:hypothetical protein